MTPPIFPQPASTVVMLRSDQKTGFEVYLNLRPDYMDTYAGVYVFPGGRVEESDCSAAMLDLTRGITAAQAREKLGADLPAELCLGFWVAAVREVFEEVGVHLFLGQTNSAALSRELYERMAKKRPMLQRGEIDFAGLLTAERVYCDLSRLIYFFHRVTPEHYSTRFDTRFYLAVLPSDQVPLTVSEEVSESVWVSPHVALERFEKGEFPMMPPTVMVLRILSKHYSWARLCATFNLF